MSRDYVKIGGGVIAKWPTRHNLHITSTAKESIQEVRIERADAPELLYAVARWALDSASDKLPPGVQDKLLALVDNLGCVLEE